MAFLGVLYSEGGYQAGQGRTGHISVASQDDAGFLLHSSYRITSPLGLYNVMIYHFHFLFRLGFYIVMAYDTDRVRNREEAI